MAIASTYNTGTASINAGETAVTGQGTTWLTSGIRAGDLFWSLGLAVRIASVNSNTSLTLAYAWPGSNRAAAAYEIRYTPDAERVLASTREMLTALGANAISPLVGLAPAADKIAYYTGAGAAALTDFKALARTLLAATTQTEARTAIGADNASGLLSGAFRGWNFGDLTASPTLDANALVGNGLWAAAAGSLNTPTATSGWGYILQFQRSSDRKTQLFVDSITAGCRMFVRIQLAGGWSSWLPLTPERGSNANGEYVRFADGTQTCTGIVTLGGSTATLIAANWSFPAAFIAAPKLSVSLPYQTANYTNVTQRTPGNITTNPSTTGATIGFWAEDGTTFPASSTIANVALTAEGRWY